MPPTRRTRASAASTGKSPSQQRLTFNAKITKPTSPSAKSNKSKLSTSVSSHSQDVEREIEVDEIKKHEIGKDVGHVSSEAVVAQQAAVEKERLGRAKTEEEEEATRVTEAQIRRYWNQRERERISPRVHQKELSVHERVLRYWDMSPQYGPAIGIARMKRWVRANKLGLEPPIEVLAVLMKEEEIGNSKIERAYVDELMASKFVVEEA